MSDKVPVSLLFDLTANGEHQRFERRVVELPADTEAVEWTMTFPPGEAEQKGGTTVRWTGKPIVVRYRATLEQARKAIERGGLLELKAELPMKVELRSGKEIVRDASGRAEAVLDCQVAQVRWDTDGAVEEVEVAA